MRPLGDILTQLPVSDDSDLLAGPTFDAVRDIAFIPHAEVAWQLFHSELMGLHELADNLSRAQDLDEHFKTRIGFMSENFWRMGFNLARAVNLEVTDA